MSELNTQIWGSGIEVNPYEGKLDENKLYYATTSEKPTGGDDSHNMSQTYTLDRLDADGKIKCGHDFDLSPCYIMVDENCPWTKSVTHQFIRVDNTNSSKRLDVGIMNETKAVPVMIGTGFVRPASNDNYCLNCSNSSSSYSGSIGMPYFMFNGWKNNKRLTNDRITQYSTNKYKTLPSVNGANFQPFVKFGGKAIIARIYVRAKGATGSYQDYSLYDYCHTGTTYTDKNKVLCVWYDARIIEAPNTGWRDKHGGAWSGSLTGTYITAVPFTSDFTFEVNESINFTASTWDMYLNDYNKPCLFGTFNSNVTLSSLKNYFNSIDTHSSYEKRASSPYIIDALTENILWGTADDFYEYFMRSAAYLGLFFTPYSDTAFPFTVTNQDEMFSNEKMYLGVIDANGVTHGEYTHGEDNEDQVQYTSKDLQKDSNVDAGGGSSPYDAVTTAHRRMTSQGVAGRWYCLPLFTTEDTYTWFQKIMTIINSPATAEDNNFYGQNPIDCILEAREVYLPQSFAGWDTSSSVRIGDLVIESGTYPNVRTSEFTSPINYNCGTIHIDEIYNDFRDYEPYTQMQLFIPFCGVVDLKPSVCMGHNITLEEEIEFTTGDILANIFIDSCLYTSINGNCGSDMSINGLAIATYAQIRSGYLQKGISDLLSAGASAVSGIAGGTIAASYGNTAGVRAQGWAGGLAAAQNVVSAIHDFDMYTNLHPTPIKIQNGSPMPQSNSVFMPFVIIQYPLEFKNFDMSEYIKLNGVACYDTGKLSEIASGLTVCTEYNLSGISCTKEEKDMIAHLLESGVIV